MEDLLVQAFFGFLSPHFLGLLLFISLLTHFFHLKPTPRIEAWLPVLLAFGLFHSMPNLHRCNQMCNSTIYARILPQSALQMASTATVFGQKAHQVATVVGKLRERSQIEQIGHVLHHSLSGSIAVSLFANRETAMLSPVYPLLV